MDKCRICLRNRKNALSIYTKEDGTSFVDMISSIVNIKIQREIGPDKICRSCRGKLTDAYNLKMNIERAEMVLQEACNMKRINFSNLNDIKIKIEIETDIKPLMLPMDNLSEKLFKYGSDCLSYNDTVIKKIDKINDNEDINKSLSVGEFLNSIKTESEHESDYQGYEIGADDYNSDSGSNYSLEKNLQMRKNKKKKSIKIKEKNHLQKCQNSKTPRRDWSEHQQIKPIKPKFIDDLRLVRTEMPVKPKIRTKKRYKYSELSVCPYCGKLSTMLNKHILIHTGERTFKCDQCTKGFFTENDLRRHEKTHTLVKKFKCDQCIAAFKENRSLRSHMLMHRDERKYVCDICNKAFKRLPILKRHKMIHNFGNKPIKCELCPMTFITQYNLRHHMRVHTGERPFKCEICSQPYSYKHDFNRHCFKKHGVFLKRRSVHVLNEEVLQQERALMRDLALRAHGIIKDGEVENPFDGPQAALAYEQAMKAIEANKIPIIF